MCLHRGDELVPGELHLRELLCRGLELCHPVHGFVPPSQGHERRHVTRQEVQIESAKAQLPAQLPSLPAHLQRFLESFGLRTQCGQVVVGAKGGPVQLALKRDLAGVSHQEERFFSTTAGPQHDALVVESLAEDPRELESLTDVEGANGYIQVIDTVLMPADKAPAPAPAPAPGGGK